MEIPVSDETIDDARKLASAAAAAGYTIRIRVSGPTTPKVLELAYASGAVALIGHVPEPSDMARALADLGCVKVITASRILAGAFVSKRGAIRDGIPLAMASGYRLGW